MKRALGVVIVLGGVLALGWMLGRRQPAPPPAPDAAAAPSRPDARGSDAQAPGRDAAERPRNPREAAQRGLDWVLPSRLADGIEIQLRDGHRVMVWGAPMAMAIA